MAFFTFVVQAAPNVTKTINFQGRLLSSSGAVVPDGYYNMQFKIYEGGSGTQTGNPDGSLKWTEAHINNGGTNGVRVRNGIFSVNLGSVASFGTSVNWDHDTLWLSMNVAGTASACSEFSTAPCTADGEMLPMKRINATPYAINAGQLNGKTSDDFLQATGSLQTGSIHMSNFIRSDTSLLAPTVDSLIDGSLSIGTVNATDITIGNAQSTTVVNGGLKITSLDGVDFTPEPEDPEPPEWLVKTNSGSRGWRSIASSADNTKLAAVVNGGYVYTSTDSGDTWAQRTSSGSRNWRFITSSDDGTKLVAVVDNEYVYTSNDSGVTWTQRTAPGTGYWQSAATSADGSKIIVAQWDGYMYTSDDSGATWTQRTNAGSRIWRAVASSADGTKLVAATYLGPIYTSIDSGATWTQQISESLQWRAIASSSDGTKLIAAAEGGHVYTSVNSGVTWTQRSSVGSRNWQSVSSSDDGAILAAVTLSGYIYFSTDSGSNWIEQTTPGLRDWHSIISANDGSKFAAAANEHYIHVYDSPPAPPAPTGSVLSIGSTNAGEINIGNTDANIQLQGDLNVGGPAIFGDTVNIQTEVDSTYAFRVQDSDGSQLFNVNTNNNIVSIGEADGTGTLLVLDTKNSGGDPVGTNGAMYYNSSAGKFRCYESGGWKDCVTPLPVSKVVQTATTSSSTTAKDVNDLTFPLAANTKYRYVFTLKYRGLGSNSATGFGITAPAGSTNSNWCVSSMSVTSSPGVKEWGSYCGTSDASSTHVVGGAGDTASDYTSNMEGYIQTGENGGDLKLRMVSGSTQTVEVSTGSFGILQIVQ